MEKSELIEIVRCAKEVFCNGIYVPCNEHPCGWDFISFDMIEIDDILDYQFENSDISNGIYYSHPFEDMTLEEILKETKGKYEFEIGNI